MTCRACRSRGEVAPCDRCGQLCCDLCSQCNHCCEVAEARRATAVDDVDRLYYLDSIGGE